MFRYSRCGFYLASVASGSSGNLWDPTLSLALKNPVLVLLETCRTRDHFKQILAQMMRLLLISQTFPMSRLLYFSAIKHPENLKIAILLFNYFTPNPNLFIYNTMISALSLSPSQSITLYKSMLCSWIYPDEHTLLALLKSSKYVIEGKHLHAHVIITGFWSHIYLQNTLIKMYSERGNMDLALQVFEDMPNKDSVSYNIMISGYARSGYSFEALNLFYDMAVSSLEPDQYTTVGLLMCCGHLRNAVLGKSVHAWIVRRKSASDWGLILNNSLLDMYVKCEEIEMALKMFEGILERDVISWNTMISGTANKGKLDLACMIFEEMPIKDLVSWNSMLSGFAKNQNWKKVKELFEAMLAENVRPDKVTILTLVSTASENGVLNQGKWAHGWAIKTLKNLDAFLGSALIDMYCKCGSIERALGVFDSVSERDVAVWTAMIAGFAFHGHGTKALELFQEMQEEDLMPNGVTIISVLTACSHAGLVDQGCRIFQSMKEKFGIEPGIEHYGCFVDLLTRAGRLLEARNVIRNMPMKPGRSIWGSLLSGCRTHGNLELAETASEELLKLEPEEEGGYILLANVYSATGKWRDSDNIREIMEGKGVKKMAGCTSIVVDGIVHEFIASDERHSMWKEIYSMLSHLSREIKFGTEETNLILMPQFSQDECVLNI